MIVTCGHCSTQFQLDDAKIPEGGVRVRCSRCTHTFTVESPQRPDADRAAELARSAIESAPADDFESDWEFNEEVASAGAGGPPAGGQDAAAAAVDQLLGGDFAESRESFGPSDSDLDAGPNEGEVAEAGASDLDGQASLGHDPLDFTGELAGSGEDDALSAFGDVGDLDTGDADDLELDDAFRAAEPTASTPAPPAAAAADSGIADEWQLDADLGPVGGARDPGIAVEHVTAQRPRRASEAPPTVAPEAPARTASPHFEDLDPDPADDAARVWARRVRNGVGWAVVLSLCLFGAIAGLLPVAPVSPSQDATRSVAGAELRAVRGRWIENAAAGPIFVVTGDLLGGGGALRTGEKLLRVRLVDLDGHPIAAESAAVGPPLPAERLREGSVRDLQDAQEVAARRMARDLATAREPRPFVAILGRIPRNSQAFEFTLGDAAPTPPAAAPEIAYPGDGQPQQPQG